jgi:hypothetical protein
MNAQFETEENHINERLFCDKLANIFLKDKVISVRDNTYHIAFVNMTTKEISLNFKSIFSGKDNLTAIMTMEGLLFHELHHLKHTTTYKKGKYPSQEVQRIASLLEDGRIETLGVLKYSKLADFFIYSVNNVLLSMKKEFLKDKPEDLLNNYILCYGRKIFWQDFDLLSKMRDILVNHYGKEIVEKVEGFVDAYIFEPTSEGRLKIAEQLYYLFASQNISFQPDDNKSFPMNCVVHQRQDSEKENDLKDLKKRFPKAKIVQIRLSDNLKDKTKESKDGAERRKQEAENKEKQQQKLMDKIRETEKLKADLNEEWRQLNDEFHKETDETKKKEIQEKTSNISGKYAKEDKKLHKQRDELSNLRDSKEKVSDEVKEKIQKLIEDMLKEVEQKNKDLLDKNQDRLLDDLRMAGHSAQGVISDSSFQPDAEAIDYSRKLSRELKKMETELISGYANKQTSGSLSVRDYLGKKDVLDMRIFSKYIPNRVKETKMLVNIFLDGSGSMASGFKWDIATKSCWIMNEALSRDQNKVMAYIFSTSFALFKRYDDPFTMPQNLHCETYPCHALDDSIDKTEAYKKANHFRTTFDIIITDGAFTEDDKSDEVIDRLNRLGHETILINVAHDDDNSHNAKHLIYLNNFNELVPAMVKIFTKVKKNLVRSVM